MKRIAGMQYPLHRGAACLSLALAVFLAGGEVRAAQGEGARGKSDKKKLYISSIRTQDLPDTFGKLVRERISLVIFDKYGTGYRLVTDDDIKVMYKQAEKMMTQGCSAETCITQIADAINADEIIYGEIRREGDKVRLVLDNLVRDPYTLHLNKKSMVNLSFNEKLIEYFVGEAAIKLIDPDYRIIEKETPQMGAHQVLDVEVFSFSTTDETIGKILNFLKEKVREGDQQFDRGSYAEAYDIYTQVFDRIRNKLSEEKQAKLGVFIEGMNRRLDQCREMISAGFDELGNTSYREYDFTSAIANFTKGREAADMIQDQARRYELSAKLIQKIENTRKTGTNYLANKVASLLDQAEYRNVTDQDGEAAGHLGEARELIIASPFVNVQIVSDFNKIAKMIQPQGDTAIPFYLDINNALVVNDPGFSRGEIFSNNIIWCLRGDRYGLLDANTGRIVAEPAYSSYLGLSEGMAAVQSGSKWGFINEYGALAIQPQFDGITLGFCGGFAQAELGGVHYAVDRTGQKFYLPVMSCEDNEQGQRKCGYLNEAGEPGIQRMFDEAREFKGGYAAVLMNGKWGFVNVYGQMAVQCQYDTVNDFSEGLSAVSMYGKWGYINPGGIQVITFQFESANDFQGGVASVVKNGKQVYVDAAGAERKDTGR